VGDLVVFDNVGSYSVVLKPPFILPNFPIIEWDGENTRVVKRKETFEDLFKTYVFSRNEE
jgi:diaminopimelate decarboxylase